MPSSADLPAWKRHLDRGADPGAHVQLGLLFQLRTLESTGSQWTAPRAATAKSIRPRGTQRLAIRPVTQSATGNWITGDVSWNDLSFKIERLGLDPRQVAWFQQFTALGRSGVDGFRASETGWLYLDDFTSELLWPLLRSAEDHGVTLVSGKRATDVRLGDHVEVTIEIGPDARAASALRLEPVALIDGAVTTITGTIADHGVYACRFESGMHLTLAPASADAVSALAWDRRALRVPTADTAEFWRDYYPALADRVPVRGRDLTLPEITRTTVLVIEHHPRDVILTRWESWIGARREPLLDPPFEISEKLQGADAAAFMTDSLTPIRDSGVHIEEIGTAPDYRALVGEPALRFVHVPVEGHNDWFDLGFVIVIGDYTVALADVFRALSRGRRRVLMVDKSWLSLDHPVFDALHELIEDGAILREWETGAIVSRYHAPVFEPFLDESDQAPEAIAWREAASALTAEPVALAAPPALRAELRAYQLEGFRRLAHLCHHRLGGILADDMGLGKTAQTIALMVHAVTNAPGRRFLVVAPTSVTGTWAAELARFAPTLRVAAVATTKDPIPGDADVVVTSYALFRLEFDRFAASRWHGLILDEAQYVKNPDSLVHECAASLDADVKFALTGTPLENGLLDLWSILRVTAPGLFPSRRGFSDRYIKAHSPQRIAELRARVRPLMLRRTKAQVELELPPKQEQIITIELSPTHRSLYERHLQRERQKVLDLVEDLDRNRFIVFRSLTLLRLLALDPRLIDAAAPGEVTDAKLDELMDRIEDLAAEGHRALVFSQFTSYLALVRERLDERGIAYEYLDGATTRRDEVIGRFRTGTAPLFLVSLRAGGVGLTLTEADYVFLLDPWWNPAAEAQAIDRTHRIGQTRPVMVYRLVARDTIEEKVLALSERKRRLFDEVIDDGDGFAGGLTAADVRALVG